MEIQRSTRDGCVVVAFTGSIDLFSVSQVQRALLRDFSDLPFALICDLAGVDTLDPVCATVFSTVANHPASRWPDTSFLLFGTRPPVAEILDRLQVPHFLQMYASLQDALDAAVARPPYLRDELRLGPDPDCPGSSTCLRPRGLPVLAAGPPRRHRDGPGGAAGQRAGHHPTRRRRVGGGSG